MKDLICPYCGYSAEETTGVNNQWESGLQIVPVNEVHKLGYKIGIAFECKECDREFFVDEDVFLKYNYQESDYEHVRNLGRSDIVRKAAEAAGMPIIREPIFKYHKYYIEVDQYDQEFLQDMAFAFGYEWKMNSQKYLDTKFRYLFIEPEIKRMWYNLSDPGTDRLVDLKGFMQALNGIEPSKKPDEIEVDGNPVEFHKDGAVTIETRDGDSCCIPYATLFDIFETAKGRIKSNE